MKSERDYSEDFKKSAVAKFLSRGNRTVPEISNEVGVNSSTLYNWRNNFANVTDMKKPSKPHSRSAQEKLKALKEYGEVPIEGRGEYLRKNGLHEEHLAEWQKQIEDALSPSKRSTQDRAELIVERRKNHELEKELRRKDKALAEASALLILKKKADLIWGTKEEK